MSTEQKVSFGYKNVTESEKSKLVNGVFSKVAAKYDFMNDVMSIGIHRLWKNHFVSYIKPREGIRVLDVAGGTGDIAFRFIERVQRAGVEDYNVALLDINEQMLEVGKERAIEEGFTKGLEWTCGDAESLPFPDCSFDAFTIAFGIRNCVHIEKVIREAFRVLRPNGQFLCLELSPDAFKHQPLLKRIYDNYSFGYIPIFGQIFAADRASYLYLVESVRKFPSMETFSKLISDKGFERVSFESLFSGIAAIHSAWKPNN